MSQIPCDKSVRAYDDRRDVVITSSNKQAIEYSTQHFLQIAQAAVAKQGLFTVALSGGSTPKAIYTELAKETHRQRLDWSRVWLFWSDERCVPHDDPKSNYRMAMEAGFSSLPIPSSQIFPMPGVGDFEENARDYDKLIHQHVPNRCFDLVMLGMGEDGHTASLFPKSHGLHSVDRLCVANFIPKLNAWRLTLTFDCINQARHIAIYVLGKNKLPTLKQVFQSPYSPDVLPIQKIGTPSSKALWITDQPFLDEL